MIFLDALGEMPFFADRMAWAHTGSWWQSLLYHSLPRRCSSGVLCCRLPCELVSLRRTLFHYPDASCKECPWTRKLILHWSDPVLAVDSSVCMPSVSWSSNITSSATVGMPKNSTPMKTPLPVMEHNVHVHLEHLIECRWEYPTSVPLDTIGYVFVHCTCLW